MTSGHRVERVTAPHEEGLRLDLALAAEPLVGSRTAAQRLIESGAVEVDGRRRGKGHRLSAGERVVVTVSPVERESQLEEGEPAEFGVAYEDEHLIVVDKPAGVVVHPSAGHATGTLAGALAGRAAGGEDPWRAGIVHRLDRDTSGLLVVAKSDDAHRALQHLIRGRELEREYRALAEGRPESATGTIDAPVGRDRGNRTLHSTRTDRPREARTHFEVLEALPRTTLLAVKLETGRTHQIRVHLQAIGHPVCGDPQYGGDVSGARLGLRRQFLHSARLAFTHPIMARTVDCTSPLPSELVGALDVARREGAAA